MVFDGMIADALGGGDLSKSCGQYDSGRGQGSRDSRLPRRDYGFLVSSQRRRDSVPLNSTSFANFQDGGEERPAGLIPNSQARCPWQNKPRSSYPIG